MRCVADDGAVQVDSLTPGTTVGYPSAVVSVVLTLATYTYVDRIDSDLTIAKSLYFGASLAAVIALSAVARTTGMSAQRVGASMCGVSTGLLLVSRLATQADTGGFPGDLYGWPGTSTILAAVLIGIAGVAVLSRSAQPDAQYWQIVAVVAAVAGVAVSAGFGLDPVPHSVSVGDDAVETQMGRNSNGWLMAAYALLVVAAWVGPTKIAARRQRRPRA